MSPIQQMLLGVGAVATKTYVDDVFSTYLYTGNNTARSINTGVDMTEGGLVWIKCRNNARANTLFDTARGVNKYLLSDHNHAENTTHSDLLTAFNNNGFSLGADANSDNVNRNNYTQASWTFRKAPGFFDVVKYTGNSSSSSQTISHSLGCVPGMIIVKSLSNTESWSVYHRELNGGVNPANYILLLDSTSGENASSSDWNNTAPTSSSFTVGIDGRVNGSGDYIAYLFAGGESTAATARSVDFDGGPSNDGDHLSSATSSDLSFGTGDYTVEFWFNADSIDDSPLFENRVSGSSSDTTGFTLTAYGHDKGVRIWWNGASRINGGASKLHTGQWYHLAATRSSGTTYLFLDGILLGTTTDSLDITTTEAHIAGGKYQGTTSITNYTDAKISNFRIIKGTALYTSSFRPPTEPLTNITNTVLLCCNGSTATSATVHTGGLTANGDPTASTDSPFDDPAGFVFGESGSESLIKCGSYVGNGSSTGPEINLGWEPSWILFKNAGASEQWQILDSMRGIVTGSSSRSLKPSSTDGNSTTLSCDLTPTGFKIKDAAGEINGNGNTIVFCAIRRPDGYVGKPPELGTDVFAMDTGNSSESIPVFDSGFPVDFAFMRIFAGSQEWYTSARLISGKRVWTQSNAAEASLDGMTFDSNSGWASKGTTYSWGNTYQSWMWKRHAGMDCISYKGDGVAGKQIPHSLSKIPEMIWIKNSDRGEAWRVYHKGLNGGTTPHNYGLKLNTTDDESAVTIWNQTAPTSTHFTINADSGVNHSGEDMRAFLFASVEGISKVGYYNGSSSTQTITTGFSPRLIIIKCVTTGSDHTNWLIMDTVRGLADGNDQVLTLNTNNAQGAADFCDVLSTGFEVNENAIANNLSGEKYIYYAHA